MEHCVKISEPWGRTLWLTDGTALLHNKGQRLKIPAAVDPGWEYEDRGCNFEFYTNKLFMELEALSPKYCQQPSQTATHIETWDLRPE